MNQRLPDTDESIAKAKAEMENKDYMGLIGILSYIGHKTRHDLLYYISFLGGFMSCPTMENYTNALSVLSYMYHTRHLQITFDKDIKNVALQSCKPPFDQVAHGKNHGIMGWSDASFGDRSQGGHTLMRLNASVCAASRKVKVKATSTTEAEIVAGVAATKDIKFARAILIFMRAPVDGQIPLLIDNDGMWKNVRNEGVSSLTRHWAKWQQFVREAQLDGVVNTHLIGTDDERADLLTKAIPKEDRKFRLFRNSILNIDNELDDK